MSTIKKEGFYPKDFKKHAIDLALSSDYPITHTARELGLSTSTLHAWIKKHQRTQRVEFIDDKDSELLKLKKELAKVTLERDILKKAAAYFAKEAL